MIEPQRLYHCAQWENNDYWDTSALSNKWTKFTGNTLDPIRAMQTEIGEILMNRFGDIFLKASLFHIWAFNIRVTINRMWRIYGLWGFVGINFLP